MRVVSQNKDYSFDFDRTIFSRQNNLIYARVGNDNKVIGQYPNADRGKEVFIDMHEFAASNGAFQYVLPEE